jgi:hypothetical protein
VIILRGGAFKRDWRRASIVVVEPRRHILVSSIRKKY